MTQSACLYIVATPIGTLADLSPRAREVLGDVAVVVCEDTRHTAKLMAHFGIETPLVSLHEHNEQQKAEALAERILRSTPPTAALVTDAGTPAVSDPGAYFVRTCREKGIRIANVPGPSALAAALASSGFQQPRVVFSGFLGRSPQQRANEFELWKRCAPCIAVAFESPRRVRSTLEALREAFGNGVEVTLSREISKRFEEHLSYPLGTLLLDWDDEKALGEYVISVNITAELGELAKAQELGSASPRLSLEEAALEIHEHLGPTPSERMNLRTLVKQSAEKHGIKAKDLYNRVLELRR